MKKHLAIPFTTEQRDFRRQTEVGIFIRRILLIIVFVGKRMLCQRRGVRILLQTLSEPVDVVSVSVVFLIHTAKFYSHSIKARGVPKQLASASHS